MQRCVYHGRNFNPMFQLNVLNVIVSFRGRVIARGIGVIAFVQKLRQVVLFLMATAKSIRNGLLLVAVVLVVMLYLVVEVVWTLVLGLLMFPPKPLHHSFVLFVSVRFCVKVIAKDIDVILFALECYVLVLFYNVEQRLKVALMMMMERKWVVVMLVAEVC